MPRVQVYLPDDLYQQLKQRGLSASELLQIALRAELQRLEALEATDAYLAELEAEVGQPTAREWAQADAIMRQIQEHRLKHAG